MTDLDLIRFQRQVARLHAKGPRVLAEMLAELGASRHVMTPIERAVDRYALIPDDALAVTGADRFPPAPIHEVRR